MHSASIQASIPRTLSQAAGRTTRTLLSCGVFAGPVFVIIGLIQSFTIPGFDLTHHYLSQLSTGELGWIQIANFVITGLLTIAAAVGVRRALAGGTLGRVSPLLLAGFGVGLAAAGFFVADPALGFPPGTPDAIPTQQSWPSMLHGVAAIVSFTLLVAACFTLGWRFARQREWGWAIFSVVAGIVSFALPAIPNPWGGVFLLVASAIGFGWLGAVCVKLARQLP